MNQTAQAHERVRRAFGIPAIAYLFGLTPEHVEMAFAESAFTGPQRTALDVLDTVREDVHRRADGDVHAEVHYLVHSISAGLRGDPGTALAAHIRSISGAPPLRSPAPRSGLVGALAQLVHEALPAELVRRHAATDAWQLHTISLPSDWNAPARLQAEDALHDVAREHDRAVDSEERYMRSVRVGMATAGHGQQSIQTPILTGSLIESTFRSWRTTGYNPNTLQATVEAVVEHVARCLAGRTARVPATIYLSGATVPEAVVLPWGTLRPVDRSSLTFPRVASEVATAAVDCTFPLKLLPWPERVEDAEVHPDIPAAQARLTDAFDRTAQAVLIACGSEDADFALHHIATEINDPFAHGGMRSWSAAPLPRPVYELSREDAARLKKAAEQLDQQPVKTIDIALRRAVIARQRLEPADALIDAIIGWEALFGSSEGEATLRITASLSRLLVATDQRTVERTRLTKLYRDRSKIVHGAKHLPAAEAQAARHQASEVLLRALRLLLTNRTDLLPLNSSDRSSRVLLE